ncbi:MAG: tetratricopeptide repeat protein [Bdellovibrionia bacterium]
MLHLRLGILSLSLFLGFGVFASEKNIDSTLVEIEYFVPGNAGEQSIRIKEATTGQLIQVVLYPSGKSFKSRVLLPTLKGSLKPFEFIFYDNKLTELASATFQNEHTVRIYLAKNGELLNAELKARNNPAVLNQAGKPVPISKPQPITRPKVAKQPVAKPSEAATPSKAAIVMPDPAKIAKVKNQVADAIKKNEEEQISLEERQAQERARKLEALAQASEEKKQQQMAKAEDLGKKAEALFAAGKFAEAAELFKQAIALNPEMDDYYYKLGICEYKLENYNESVANLSLAEVPLSQMTEKSYYLGLNYIKLDDYDKALKNFNSVQEDNDAELSPISAYMAGTIYYQRQNFKEARQKMEYILEKSKDPELDRSADTMLDQIDRWERFLQAKKEKYRFGYTIGLTYDQNVLNVATDSISTDVQAYRLNYGINGKAYLYKSLESEWAAQLNIDDIYSVDSSFKNNATLQTADPLSINLLLPYFVQLKKFALDVTPFYRSIAMSTGGGSRSELISTVGVGVGSAFTLSSNSFFNLKLDVMADTYKLDVSEDDDQSGQKIGLTTTYGRLLDLKGDRSWSADLSYMNNETKGITYDFQKIGLAATYNQRLNDKWSWMGRGDFYNQNYINAVTKRSDNVLTASAGATRSYGPYKQLSIQVQQMLSQSEVDAYNYNKTMLQIGWTQNWSILE